MLNCLHPIPVDDYHKLLISLQRKTCKRHAMRLWTDSDDDILGNISTAGSPWNDFDDNIVPKPQFRLCTVCLRPPPPGFEKMWIEKSSLVSLFFLCDTVHNWGRCEHVEYVDDFQGFSRTGSTLARQVGPGRGTVNRTEP